MGGVKLARNAGHQKALLAGIQAAVPAADCVISVDADLQDDLEAIGEFVVKYREGFDIVYGVRRQRAFDSWFKRSTAQGFYRLLRTMGVDVVPNHADYRLSETTELPEGNTAPRRSAGFIQSCHARRQRRIPPRGMHRRAEVEATGATSQRLRAARC